MSLENVQLESMEAIKIDFEYFVENLDWINAAYCVEDMAQYDQNEAKLMLELLDKVKGEDMQLLPYYEETIL